MGFPTRLWEFFIFFVREDWTLWSNNPLPVASIQSIGIHSCKLELRRAPVVCWHINTTAVKECGIDIAGIPGVGTNPGSHGSWRPEYLSKSWSIFQYFSVHMADFLWFLETWLNTCKKISETYELRKVDAGFWWRQRGNLSLSLSRSPAPSIHVPTARQCRNQLAIDVI